MLLDISYYIAQHARSLTVSIRRWPGVLIPRTLDGLPTDYDTSRLHHSFAAYANNPIIAMILGLLVNNTVQTLMHFE